MDGPLHYRSSPFVFAAIQSIASLQYYCLAAIALLYYDFALTIGQEVDRVWKQKFSIVSCIFFLNRYLTCLGYIPIVYFLFHSPTNEKACTMFARFPGALSTITQFFVVVLLVMRVYALYQRKLWILWVTIPLGVLTVGVSAWGLTQVEAVTLSFGRQALFKACVPSNLKSNTIFKVSWLINGAFDTVVFALTVYKTCSLCKEHRRVGMQSGLAQLLARDGGMFYAIMAIANVVNAISFLMGENTFFEQSAGNNSVLTHTLSSTLLTRLILNLREAGSAVDANSSRFSTRFSFSSAPRDDIMLVSTSTFSNSATMRSSDPHPPCLSTVGSTVVGSIAYEAPNRSQDSRV